MKLTRREEQVKDALISGRAPKQIAFDLGITEATLKVYTSNLYRKSGVQSRYEIISKGYQERIDELEFIRLALMQRVRELEEQLGERRAA